MIMVIGPHKKKAEAKAEQRRQARTRTPRRGAAAAADAAPRRRTPAADGRRGVDPPSRQRQAAETASPGRHSSQARRTPGTRPDSDDEGETAAMPKMKTHSGAKKRFRLTGTGKVMREQAGRRHLLEHKSSTLTRRLSRTTSMLARADAKKIKRLLGK